LLIGTNQNRSIPIRKLIEKQSINSVDIRDVTGSGELKGMQFKLGVKSDPIEYRYTFPWLFRLMAEEGATSLQLGTFFEFYQLPDEYFLKLKSDAEQFGISIDSVFTAHRELGGFFQEDPAWSRVARKNFERLIEVGALVGANSVGSNPGAVPRDRMSLKPQGLRNYIANMEELMAFSREKGVDWLTIEPMSCLAEPPTLPDEIVSLADELKAFHASNPDNLAEVGYCVDIAHGYLDASGKLGYSHVELFEATLPYLYEIHLKNTDARFHSTFGFDEASLEKGIVDVTRFRELLQENESIVPVDTVHCYLEIGGPKLGRDYSDVGLESELRKSLSYLREHIIEGGQSEQELLSENWKGSANDSSGVVIAPSMMCVDALNFESSLRAVESLGVDMLHIDIMDGHFVPNLPMGMAILEALSSRSKVPLDVHLMVEDNELFLGFMEKLGVYQISVHAETCSHLDRTLTRIREMGAKASVALNPSTPLSALEFVLDRIDSVLLMTVNPGFAGQMMTPASFHKIAECRAFLDERNYSEVSIQVDGNVSFGNIERMVAAGARSLVAGSSSIFSPSAGWDENLCRMKQAIRNGLEQSDRKENRLVSSV